MHGRPDEIRSGDPKRLRTKLTELNKEIKHGSKMLLKIKEADLAEANEEQDRLRTLQPSLQKELKSIEAKPHRKTGGLADVAMAQLDGLADWVRDADSSVVRDALKMFYDSVTLWWTMAKVLRPDQPRTTKVRKRRVERGLVTLRVLVRGLQRAPITVY